MEDKRAMLTVEVACNKLTVHAWLPPVTRRERRAAPRSDGITKIAFTPPGLIDDRLRVKAAPAEI